MTFFTYDEVPKDAAVGDVVVIRGVRFVLVKKLKGGWCVEYA